MNFELYLHLLTMHCNNFEDFLYVLLTHRKGLFAKMMKIQQSINEIFIVLSERIFLELISLRELMLRIEYA